MIPPRGTKWGLISLSLSQGSNILTQFDDKERADWLGIARIRFGEGRREQEHLISKTFTSSL